MLFLRLLNTQIFFHKLSLKSGQFQHAEVDLTLLLSKSIQLDPKVWLHLCRCTSLLFKLIILGGFGSNEYSKLNLKVKFQTWNHKSNWAYYNYSYEIQIIHWVQIHIYCSYRNKSSSFLQCYIKLYETRACLDLYVLVPDQRPLIPMWDSLDRMDLCWLPWAPFQSMRNKHFWTALHFTLM